MRDYVNHEEIRNYATDYVIDNLGLSVSIQVMNRSPRLVKLKKISFAILFGSRLDDRTVFSLFFDQVNFSTYHSFYFHLLNRTEQCYDLNYQNLGVLIFLSEA